MAFCTKCGAQVPDGANNCPNCGAPAEFQQQAQQPQQNMSAQDFVNNINNTPDFTAEYDYNDVNNNKVMGVLAYFGILFLVPLLAAPNSKFARFHANQGLVLFLANLIAGVALGIVGVILALIPYVGLVLSTIIYLAYGILSLVLAIMGIVNAAQGKAKQLPLIGKITILK